MATAIAQVRLSGHHKSAKNGRKKHPREEIFGASFSHKIKKWLDLRRVIDRENDWYEETVTDSETGEVVHECKERLSAHKGHGSAKRR